MKKTNLLLTGCSVASLAAFVSAHAQDAPGTPPDYEAYERNGSSWTDGVYLQLHGGVNVIATDEWDVRTDDGLNENTVEFDYDTGFLVGGAIGKRFTPNVRVEAEVTYRQNDADEESVNTLEGTPVNVDGELGLWSFMANGYYDFQPRGAWTPYVGAGLGIAVSDAEDVDETAFAYQTKAGLARQLKPGTSLGLEAGYFGTTDFEGDDNVDEDESQVEFDYGSVQVLAFLRKEF